MPRPRTLSPALTWHKRARQYVTRIGGVMKYLGRDKAEAERRRCLLIAAHLANEPLPTFDATPKVAAETRNVSAGPLVAELLARYGEYAEKRCDPRQFWRIRIALDATCKVCGATPALEFGPKRLKDVRQWLLERPSQRPRRLMDRICELLREAPREVASLDAQLRTEGFSQPCIQVARRRLGLAGRPGRGSKQRVVSLPLDAGKTTRLSRNYVNSLIGCIQTAWQWLAAEELVPAEKALALRSVAALRQGESGRETPQIVAVSPEVVDATLPFCSPTIQAMVRFQQYTGCRPGEVCRMRPCDLSRSSNERIEVPGTKPPMLVAALEVGSVTVWVYVPSSHKTIKKGKRRLVPVGPRAQVVLEPFLKGRETEAYLFSPREASDAWRASCGRRKQYGRGREPGERYTSDSYREAVVAGIERARRGGVKVPDWSPAALRKLAATLSDEKADRQTTAALLGHSSPDVSAIYSNQALERAARHVANFG